MIDILILEDEIPARKKLKRFIGELDRPTRVVAELDTVSDAVAFLEKNGPDLIFSDIELLDGNAFEIYDRVSVSCPIIFTTAYDQFWMDAFDNNGIAYLLKPFSQERFQKAWDKYLLLVNSPTPDQKLFVKLNNLLEQNLRERSFKKRFTLHLNSGRYFLDTVNINFIEASDGVVFAHDTMGKKHLLTETTLKEIEGRLDPSEFYRINRSQLISKKGVERLERHTKNALAIKLKGHPRLLFTSQSSTTAFRNWIEQ